VTSVDGVSISDIVADGTLFPTVSERLEKWDCSPPVPHSLSFFFLPISPYLSFPLPVITPLKQFLVNVDLFSFRKHATVSVDKKNFVSAPRRILE